MKIKNFFRNIFWLLTKGGSVNLLNPNLIFKYHVRYKEKNTMDKFSESIGEESPGLYQNYPYNDLK